MTTLQTALDLDARLRELAAKYAVDVPEPWRLTRTAETAAAGQTCLIAGCSQVASSLGASCVPLLPWRSERRFVELKRILDSRTLESLSMCRFSCLTSGQPLDLAAILYREFDLAEWLADSPIAALQANIAGQRAANVVVRLENGVVCSVEAGITLPPGTQPAILDRHELIARRGVASDRVVDSQVPQCSIYTFSARGAERFTDTDAELFGLEADDAALVRAAYELVRQPEGQGALRSQHERLVQLVRLAYESDRQRQCLTVKGEC